jgi:hypothetical protein
VKFAQVHAAVSDECDGLFLALAAGLHHISERLGVIKRLGLLIIPNTNIPKA